MRSPVVTAREGQVEHLFPTHFHRGEYRLRLFLPAVFFGALLRIVEVENIEHVRQSVFLNRAAVRQLVDFDVVDRSADVGLQRPIVSEGLVDVHHNVSISLRIVFALFGIVTVLTAVGNRRIRRSIKFLRIERVRIVDAHTASNVQPRKNVIGGRERQHVTLLIGVAQVAVGNPIRILHAQVTALKVVRPKLFHKFRGGIVTLENTIGVEVRPAGKKISRNQRVGIDTLIGHVLILLVNIAGRSIQTQLVFQEIGRITKCEIVTVVFIIGNDTVRIDRGCRKVSLVLVRTARYRHGVGVDVSCLEKIIRRISQTRRRCQFLAPAVNGRTGLKAV